LAVAKAGLVAVNTQTTELSSDISGLLHSLPGIILAVILIVWLLYLLWFSYGCVKDNPRVFITPQTIRQLGIRRVLIIDDRQSHLDRLKKIFSEQGCFVEEAIGISQAQYIIKKEKRLIW